MSEISNRVKEIIVDKLGVDENEVTPAAELIMEFEKEFGITIPDEDAEKIQTVQDAISYVENAKK